MKKAAASYEKPSFAEKRRNQLWHNYKLRGCEESRGKLIEEYAYLAKYAVDRVHTSPYGACGYDDLMSAAIIGLIKAVDKFDLSREVTFSTYAMVLIRGAVMDAIRAADWTPRRVRKNEKLLSETTTRLTTGLGRPPDQMELANALSLTVDKLECMQAECAQAAVYSLDQVLAERAKITGDYADQDEHLDRLRLMQWLQRAIATLPEQELQLIRLYYYDRLTLQEIAEVFGVCKQRICQLHTRAIHRLDAMK